MSFIVSMVITFMCQGYFMTEKFVAENFVMRHSFLYCLPYFLIGGLLFLYKDEISQAVIRFKGISLCIVVALTVGYYISPNVVHSTDIVVIKTLLLYTGWMCIALGSENILLSNRFTRYISGISMEMYLSHMVAFRFIEKMGMANKIENPIFGYLTTYIILVLLLVVCLTIYRKVTNKLAELR